MMAIYDYVDSIDGGDDDHDRVYDYDDYGGRHGGGHCYDDDDGDGVDDGVGGDDIAGGDCAHVGDDDCGADDSVDDGDDDDCGDCGGF